PLASAHTELESRRIELDGSAGQSPERALLALCPETTRYWPQRRTGTSAHFPIRTRGRASTTKRLCHRGRSRELRKHNLGSNEANRDANEPQPWGDRCCLTSIARTRCPYRWSLPRRVRANFRPATHPNANSRAEVRPRR